MEIVNSIYGKDCIVLPHRRYDLITGEFRAANHSRYLGSVEERWDPQSVLDQASFVHFSDWPLPKPWMHHMYAQVNAAQPDCHGEPDSDEWDCRDREIWLGLHQDFRERRELSLRVYSVSSVAYRELYVE